MYWWQMSSVSWLENPCTFCLFSTGTASLPLVSTWGGTENVKPGKYKGNPGSFRLSGEAQGGPPAIFEEKWSCSAPQRPGPWVQEAGLCCFGAGIPRAKECACLLGLLFLLLRLARPDPKRKFALPTFWLPNTGLQHSRTFSRGSRGGRGRHSRGCSES